MFHPGDLIGALFCALAVLAIALSPRPRPLFIRISYSLCCAAIVFEVAYALAVSWS